MAADHSADPLDFSCNCGQLQGQIAASALKSGTHAVCYCRDCRAAELYLEQPDPAPGPVDLFQTTPDAITLTEGAQYLGLFRLGPRGLMRWYATCCGATLFNTLAKPKLAFVGVQVARLATPERVGPVQVKGNMLQPDGKVKHQGMSRMLWTLASRMLSARLSGQWRQTPFFDSETGEPVVAPKILSKQERARLYPAQRKISG